MKEIVFACPWGTDKKLSWSGTHYALYCALAEYYQLVDFNTSCNKIDSVDVLLYRILKKGLELLGIDSYDMELLKYSIVERKAKKLKYEKQTTIFQFDASPLSESRKSYIYIDMYYGFLKELYMHNKAIFEKSNFNNVSYKKILERTKYQDDFFANCKGIFTMGRWIAEELVNQYGIPVEKVHHVGGGCNVNPQLIKKYKKYNNKILFIGREFERKNGWLTIEAFRKVREVKPEAELYIAGTEGLNLNEKGIYELGDLSEEELSYYLNICDIFCMPSKFEAYGLVFGEALIYGLPCIGLSAYEMPYFIEDGVNGYLLQHEDSGELMFKMIDLLENEKIKNNVQKNHKHYLQKYSWKSVAKNIYDVIERDY